MHVFIPISLLLVKLLITHKTETRYPFNMPVVLLERLPLPSLRTYTTISVTLLACALHYASQVVSERRQVELEEARKNASLDGTLNISDNSSDVFDTGQVFITTAVSVLLDETWCVWVSYQL